LRQDDGPSSPGDVALVMLVAGVCGVFFGLTSGWQIPVESAQALAGVVNYPADNPFYMYHVQSWTLLHQVPAALLACGLSEEIISMFLGCVAAVLGFEALALGTLAIGGNRLMACALPSIVLVTNVYKECGAVYQTHLVSDIYWTTYGVTGNGYVLLAWSLLGLGYRRWAAFLCGLAPAVHPLLGTWCIAMAAASLAWDWRAQRQHATAMLRWFTVGAVITIGSFALQRYLAGAVPPVDPELASRLLKAFVADWDNHRHPYPLDHIEWKIGCCALAVVVAACAWHSVCLPDRVRVLLRIVLVSSLLAVAFCPLTHFLDRLPSAIAMAMPGRFINLAALALPALVIGLLTRWRRESWAVQGLLTGLMLFCLLRALMLKRQLIYVPNASKVFVAAGLILVYLLAATHGGHDSLPRRIARWATLAGLVSAGWAWSKDWHLAALLWTSAFSLWAAQRWLAAPRPLPMGKWLFGVALACAAAIVVMAVGPWLAVGLAAAALTPALWRPRGLISPASSPPRPSRVVRPRLEAIRYRRVLAVLLGCVGLALIGARLTARADEGLAPFRQWRDDPVFSAARRSQGLILTCPRMGIVQLRARRGVVLNGEAMNQITYVPASGPGMNRVLQRIFGDDLLRPRPAGWEKLGGLMYDSGQELWERRESGEWRRLAAEFAFTNVLTYGDWTLKLPVVARDENLILYNIPTPNRRPDWFRRAAGW
jgi:hypothetical protein